MSYFYIPNPVPKTTYIGNSLSSINISLTALDFNLKSLSSFTLTEFETVYSTIDTVSANLSTRITSLSTEVFGVTALPIATLAEAEAGVVTNKLMTPQRTADAIAALAITEDVFTESVYSGFVNFYIDSDRYRIAADLTLPDPVDVATTVNFDNTEITVTWNSTPSASSFIYRTLNVNSFGEGDLIATVAPTVQAYVDTTFTLGVAYDYRIIASDGNNNTRSEPSPPAYAYVE
jgi:hypothetical protein